jgi:hypothetical protein
MSIDTPQIPIPQNLQIHAQNGPSIDSIDSIDILQDSNYYCCYYCSDFRTDSKGDYETHVIMRHGHSPAYPNKPEIEKLRLKAQGRNWEI